MAVDLFLSSLLIVVVSSLDDRKSLLDISVSHPCVERCNWHISQHPYNLDCIRDFLRTCCSLARWNSCLLCDRTADSESIDRFEQVASKQRPDIVCCR